jgi:hypothetical protein
MNTIKSLSNYSLLFMTLTIPAFAAVTVNSPENNTSIASPFSLSATASSCSSQTVAAMGYSLDNSSDTTIVEGTSVDALISSGTGAHTLHVKAWGDKGSSCVTDVDITVTAGGAKSLSIPSNATKISGLQVSGDWHANHDKGGTGSASGVTSIVSSPSHSGSARRFETSFKNNGDERYDVSFGDDESATNFLYDGWVYLPSSAKSIGNLEMDLNQVMSNGHTVIFGVQCDGWSGTWDYTRNGGSATHKKDEWVHSDARCNPRSWSVDTWHHVQISYSRDGNGMVTYHSVWLDNAEQKLNVTVFSAFALGWAPSLLTNFQVDGLGSSGSNTVFLDDLAIYRW